MANFHVAELQAKAQRAARDLAQFLHRSLNEPDAIAVIEEREVEVRYRYRCIRKMIRSRSRCFRRHDENKNAPTSSFHRDRWRQAS